MKKASGKIPLSRGACARYHSDFSLWLRLASVMWWNNINAPVLNGQGRLARYHLALYFGYPALFRNGEGRQT